MSRVDTPASSATPANSKPLDAPTFKDDGHAATQKPKDKIDEASMESFPASDPPASHRSVAVPPKQKR